MRNKKSRPTLLHKRGSLPRGVKKADQHYFISTLANELLDCFNCRTDTPSPSAFVQQRAKISYEAFEEIFKIFTKSVFANRLHNGYKVIAADGSDIHFAFI